MSAISPTSQPKGDPSTSRPGHSPVPMQTAPEAQFPLEKWYYAEGTQSVGPLSSEAMRDLRNSGALEGDCWVRKDGEEQWRTLDSAFGDGPDAVEETPTGSRDKPGIHPAKGTNDIRSGGIPAKPIRKPPQCSVAPNTVAVRFPSAQVMRRNQIVVFAAVGLVIAVIGGVLYFSGGGEVRSGGNGRDAHTKVPAVIPTTNSVEPTKENEVSVASGKSESRMPFVNDRERVDSIAGGGAGTSSNERNQDTVPAQKPQPEGGRGIDSSTAGGGQAPSVRPPANSPGGESAGIGVPSGAAETSNGSAAKSPDAMIANVVEGFDRPTIEQARECVAKLERLQTEYPDSDTIRLVKDSIMRVFRAEAAFVAAKKALPAARKLANEKLNSAGICARPSPLTGRVDMEGYERFTAEASQILADAQAKLNRTQTELDNAIKAAETSTGHRFGARIERIWADVNSRNPRTPQVRE